MDIQKKFEAGRESHTYQRIDANYSVNIFLGYNEKGNMSMIITENGVETKVKSSKFIEVSLKRREDKKLALAFDLLDEAYNSLFLIFCKDIITVCEKAGVDMAISNALMRWKYWRELFGRQSSHLLDSQEIKGLIGELIVLKDRFIPKYDVTKCIESWMGPLLGHKDFEISDTWYEVKTIPENATQVTISSLEQLEADNDGHLMIVRLEDSNAVTDNAITLNQLVTSIVNLIDDPETIDLFRSKLDNMGYCPDSEYDKYNYLLKSVYQYKITPTFPRLRRKNTNPNIANVKYSILLNGIRDFLED